MTPETLVYSAAAIARILECPAKHITNITVGADYVQCQRKGEAIAMPRQALHNEFVRFRQVNGDRLRELGLVTRESQTVFQVQSQKLNETYHLELTPSAVHCSCEDYQQQTSILGKGVCKHGYAVLGALGFRTLSQFQETVERQALSHQLDHALARRTPATTHRGASID